MYLNTYATGRSTHLRAIWKIREAMGAIDDISFKVYDVTTKDELDTVLELSLR